jgi:O-antigen ligase
METILQDNQMNNRTQMTLIKRIGADFLKQLSALICPIRVIRVLFALPFLLTLCTVFFISDELANGVVSGKYFWFYGSMGVVGLVILLTVVVSKTRFRFSILDLLVLLFTGSIYLSAFVWNDASQNTTKLTLFGLLIVLYFSLRLSRGLRVMRIMTIVFILTGLVEAVWGLRQLYGCEPSQHSLFKLTGSFFNPGPYAGYLAVVFPMALHYFLFVNSRLLFPVKWMAGITCVAILSVLPAAMSRASWLAVVAGSCMVVGAHYAKRFSLKSYYLSHKKQIAIIACGIILCLSVATTGMYFLKKDSADGRALTWKISLQAVLQHPLGVGLGNFPAAYGEAQAAYFASGKATETEEHLAGNPEYGFNEYLQILIESGIISFLLFIGIIVAAFRSMAKMKDWGKMGSLTALLTFACFSYPFSVLPFLIVFVFLISSAQWNADDADRADNRGFLNNYSPKGVIRAHPRHLRSILLALFYLLAVSFCLYKQYPVYNAYKQWKQERIYYHAGMYKEVVKSYETLYPQLNDQIQFLFEYAQSLSKSERYTQSNKILQRAMQISCDPMLYNIMGKNYQALKEYEQAEAYFIQSTQIVPSRLYPWYLLTKLYHEMGLQDKVEKTAETVLTKEPKVHSRAVEEMRGEVRKLKIKNEEI